MQLTDEQIAELQSLYEKRFGEKINHDEAAESGARLIRLLQIICQPMQDK